MTDLRISRQKLDQNLTTELDNLTRIAQHVQNDLSVLLSQNAQLKNHPELSRLQDLDRLTQSLEGLTILHKNLSSFPSGDMIPQKHATQDMPLLHLTDALFNCPTSPHEDELRGCVDFFSAP
ncbi:MAG: hypothetical protein ACPGVK_00155 [Halocynthiibacter sp.]